MAEILQSHLSHPVLSFYRALHWGQSWLVSLTTVLDVCALLIAGGEGLLEAQARITYRMGLRLHCGEHLRGVSWAVFSAFSREWNQLKNPSYNRSRAGFSGFSRSSKMFTAVD
jgi:hypothetical protein